MGKLIYSLRHKFLFSVFVYFFILIFLSLGTWQLIRLNWKIELISEINNSLDDDAVSFDGKYPKNYKKVKFDVDINDTQVIFLYSLNENGEPGFDVINSIKIDNFNYLLNRGWIPKEMKDKPFEILDNSLEGILREKSKKNIFKPDNNLKDNYWFTLNDNDLLSFTGKAFSKFIIYETNNNNLFPKTKKINANISNNHLKYSLTWFSLAISIFLIYLYFRKKNY